jgi:F0F1-type ATP synthase assembly protein I
VAKISSEWASNWRTLGLGFSLLALLVAGPLAGYLLGDWLDRTLGTSWLTWFCLLIGFAAAWRQVYLIARRIQREQDQPPPDSQAR